MRWITTAWWRKRASPPPAPPRDPSSARALAPPLQDPIPLSRVFPPLPAADQFLARESIGEIGEDDIEAALRLLRGGGMVRGDGPIRRVTRPARFHIANQHVQGFCQQCLATQHGSRIPLNDMYAGYLLWAADWQRDPINKSDFDFAMSDYLASVGGIRTERYYNGCRFRPDFLRKLEGRSHDEIKKRLGSVVSELTARHEPQA
jgi:hypothetical protein